MMWAAIAMVGTVAGVMSSLLGIGGGLIIVPALVYFFKMPIHYAVGTSLAVIIPTSLVGTWRHALVGNVDWKTAALIALFSAVGSYVGVALAVRVPEGPLKKIFAVFLVCVAVKLFFEKS